MTCLRDYVGQCLWVGSSRNWYHLTRKYKTSRTVEHERYIILPLCILWRHVRKVFLWLSFTPSKLTLELIHVSITVRELWMYRFSNPYKLYCSNWTRIPASFTVSPWVPGKFLVWVAEEKRLLFLISTLCDIKTEQNSIYPSIVQIIGNTIL
jgi:hypothetical protein